MARREGTGRRDIDATTNWNFVLGAGALAGALALAAAMVAASARAGWSAWTPIRVVGAMLGGPRALEPLAGRPELGVVFSGLLVHLVLSTTFAVLLVIGVATVAGQIQERPALMGAAGAAFGLFLYGLNFHLLTAIFPWFALARGLPTAALHVGYGAIGAAGYAVLVRRRPGPNASQEQSPIDHPWV